MISGKTTVIAHLGYPTEAFKAPMIYNPYFEQAGIDAVVMPMGVKAEDYPSFLRPLFTLTNIRGALVTMPHKVTTVALLDEVTPTAQIAGSCNAILKRPDGSLLGDMFDGAGFVRGVERKGRQLAGAQRAGRRRRRRRLGDRRVARGGRRRRRSGCSTPTQPRPTRSADRLREHYPKLDGAHRLEGSGRLRRRRQRDAARHEAGRSAADGRRRASRRRRSSARS